MGTTDATVHRLGVAAAFVLGLLATTEVALDAANAERGPSAQLVLALSATTPLALARTHLWASAGTITAANVMALVAYERPTAAGLVALVAVFYRLGQASLRRRRAQALQRDAIQQTAADALLAHAARGERARIARELHDMVAHHISIIAVQAETARLATPGMPDAGAERLRAIGDTARTALTEMRRLLGVLREDADTPATRQPQPGLQQLNELVDDARDSSRAGVRLIVRGRVRRLDPGVELTAYRIVQEALTNARRHAPGAAVDVELGYTGTELHLRIRDNGPGPGSGRSSARTIAGRSMTSGHGLLGMRERTATVGGTLRIGTAIPAGFVVDAVLPAPQTPGDPSSAPAEGSADAAGSGSAPATPPAVTAEATR